MKQLKEMPVEIKSPAPRFRYWFTPPEIIKIRAIDIEPFVPKAIWKSAPSDDLTFEIPAEKVFARNVPRIPLRLLAELLPDHILPSDGLVKLPAARLAASYHLVEHKEELPPEKLPEPEVPVVPEPDPEPTVDVVLKSEPVSDTPLSPPSSLTIEPPVIAPPVAAPASEPPLPQTPTSSVSNDPAPISESPVPVIPPASEAPQIAIPSSEAASVTSVKFPPRRTGSFVGLPIFRRKTPVAVPNPTVPPPAGLSSDATSVEPLAPELNPKIILPQISIPTPPPAPPVEPPLEAPSISEIAAVEIPVAEVPPVEIPAPEVPEVSAPVQLTTEIPVRILRTEHFTKQDQGQEIVEQEPLQALFLTEETMTVNRVIELCGGLPGINSCVLAHGSVVVASHNVPESVDLVSMSAHAADMLRAMRDSSARMGVGTVPAVTLHTEKGVISFFNREDLTMLVFHKDRGFVPGVREKMAAVLGELSKARLTLPVSGEES